MVSIPKINRGRTLIERIIETEGIDYVIEVIKSSDNKTDAVLKLGIEPTRSSKDFIEFLVEDYSIDVDFKDSWNQTRLEEIFVDHGDGKRRDWRLRKRALLAIGRPYECEGCGNNGVWNKNPLVLEIDHINGRRDDDRKENLRFLCPNCHSQTRNYKVPFAKRRS